MFVDVAAAVVVVVVASLQSPVLCKRIHRLALARTTEASGQAGALG